MPRSYSIMNINSEEEFKKIYVQYFQRLKRFAVYYALDEADAENIVQDVFLKLWENRSSLEKENFVFSYLFVLVKNKCLDYLRHKQVTEEYKNYAEREHYYEIQYKLNSLTELHSVTDTEEHLYKKLQKALDALPPKCREIFIKSKLEGKKYREIAQEMNLSEKTVENQIGIAFKKITSEVNAIPLIILLFIG